MSLYVHGLPSSQEFVLFVYEHLPVVTLHVPVTQGFVVAQSPLLVHAPDEVGVMMQSKGFEPGCPDG